MGANSLHLKNRQKKHNLLTIFLSEDKSKMQLILSCCALEVAGDITKPIGVTSLKFREVTGFCDLLSDIVFLSIIIH